MLHKYLLNGQIKKIMAMAWTCQIMIDNHRQVLWTQALCIQLGDGAGAHVVLQSYSPNRFGLRVLGPLALQGTGFSSPMNTTLCPTPESLTISLSLYSHSSWSWSWPVMWAGKTTHFPGTGLTMVGIFKDPGSVAMPDNSHVQLLAASWSSLANCHKILQAIILLYLEPNSVNCVAQLDCTCLFRD